MIKHCSLYCIIVVVGGSLYSNVGVGAVRTRRDVDDNGYSRPPPPAILSHKQAVTNDGVFNYIFAADNGLKQGESISPDGTRTGAYQYIDPNGKTISVKYTAGKDGFRIIEGDHIPPQPQPVKPIPEYQPPEYREKLEGNHGNEKYKTSIKTYNNYPEENRRYKQDEPRYVQEQPRYRQEEPSNYRNHDQQDRYHQPNSPKNLFRPAQSEGQQRAFQRPQQQQQQQNPQRARSMLYDVEQRHDVNYRKYLDNGQAADGQNENQVSEPAHHFGGGYNFEFKG